MPRRATASLRLFVAVYPPMEVAQQLVALLEGLGLPPYRAAPLEQVHLTLHFIGDTRAADVSDVVESVHRAAAGLPPCELNVTGLTALPEKPPARLVAATFEPEPTVEEIHRRLVTRLARKARGSERFLPHMTLARFRQPGPAPGLELPAVSRVSFQVTEAVLVQSVLRASGAEHAVLERVPLKS